MVFMRFATTTYSLSSALPLINALLICRGHSSGALGAHPGVSSGGRTKGMKAFPAVAAPNMSKRHHGVVPEYTESIPQMRVEGLATAV